MPAVDVYYRMNLHMSDEPATSIDSSIRHFGSTELSVEEKVLGVDDFSVKWHTPTKFDKLTHDIIVRVRLDSNFKERRTKVTDDLCEAFARIFAEDLNAYYGARVITIGVEIMLVGFGLFWGSASTSSR